MTTLEEMNLRQELESEQRTGHRQLLLKRLWNLQQHAKCESSSGARLANRHARKVLVQPTPKSSPSVTLPLEVVSSR